MSNEKRFALFVILMFAWLLGSPYLLRSLGLIPPPQKKPPAAVADALKANPKDEPGDLLARNKATQAEKTAENAPPGAKVRADGKSEPTKSAQEKSKAPQVALVEPDELVLGSVTDKSPTGYRLQVQLEQKGAGVDEVSSSRYDADFEGRNNPHRPLHLIRRDPTWPASLSLTLAQDPLGPKPQADKHDQEAAAGDPELPTRAEDLLDSLVWDVVRDQQGKIKRQLTKEDPVTKSTVAGEEVVFRTTAPSGVIVTKTFRLWQDADGFEVDVKFESPDKERTVSYNLMGPHGIPIEGEWYTGTFRDVFFGTINRGVPDDPVSYTAYDVAKAKDKPIVNSALPLLYAGVENQYFATFFEVVPPPTGNEDRRDRETTAIVLHADEKALQKADVSVRMSSRPFQVGPNLSQVHSYRVFAGPKTADALLPFGAEKLAGYRKSQWIPLAPFIGRVIITPTLSLTYQVTEWVAHLFGSTKGNYGIAIILLTLLVKLLMFPLGRKQALMAQRTQALQPYLKEIQEKYKDDKEKQTRETLALYKRHGVNPVSGCIPALIQLPIFVGLWQALNTSVALRHAPFLWINDLAAPDMLFKFPFEIMFLGNWFNLLPILVVSLMLVQTKLFSPPPTTPEAEMQQKTMKYMMIFMAVMFYKVPAGLGIYFITSSIWSIGERLLLPKIAHAPAKIDDDELDQGHLKAVRGKEGLDAKGAPGGNGAAPPMKPKGAFSQFWEKLLDEARKDPTYRKMIDESDGKDKEKDKDRGRPDSEDRRDRDRGKPRARPGRK